MQVAVVLQHNSEERHSTQVGLLREGSDSHAEDTGGGSLNTAIERKVGGRIVEADKPAGDSLGSLAGHKDEVARRTEAATNQAEAVEQAVALDLCTLEVAHSG